MSSDKIKDLINQIIKETEGLKITKFGEVSVDINGHLIVKNFSVNGEEFDKFESYQEALLMLTLVRRLGGVFLDYHSRYEGTYNTDALNYYLEPSHDETKFRDLARRMGVGHLLLRKVGSNLTRRNT